MNVSSGSTKLKPPKLDLSLKRLARAAYFNAVRLYKDACLLFKNNSYASAYFSSLASIEELGKVKMIDHFYADMRLNNEVFGFPKDTFVNALFARSHFYNHRDKQESAMEGTQFGWNTPEEFKDIPELFSSAEKERQRSVYVDFSKGVVTTPEDVITKGRVLKSLKVGLHIFEEMEDMGLAGTYWTDTPKTKRRALAIVGELKKLLSDLP